MEYKDKFGADLPAGSRRWWQVLVRGVVVCASILVLVYITIPWWAPAGIIKDMLIADLEKQMGVNVEISDLSLSWSQGVSIKGLVLHCPLADKPEGFGDEPMLNIDELNCDLSPLGFLINHKLDWVEIKNMALSVRADPTGAVNVAAFGKLSLDIDIGWLAVRQSTVSFDSADYTAAPLEFSVSDLQWIHDDTDALGEISMTAALPQGHATAAINLSVSTRQKSPEQIAVARFHFANLDLSKLPQLQPFLKKLPIRKIHGRCNGDLSFGINNNLEIDHVVMQLAARGLNVQPVGNIELPVIDEAGLKLTATLDSFNNCLKIHSLSVRLPGIDITGQASVHSDILRGDWAAIDSAALTGVVYPARILAVVTGRPQLVGDVAVAGPVRIDFTTRQDGGAFETDMKVAAREMEIRRGNKIIKPAGVQMRFDLACLVRPESVPKVDVNNCTFMLGENIISGRASWIGSAEPHSPESSLAQQIIGALDTIRGRGNIEISEPGSLRTLFGAVESKDYPRLAGMLRGTWSLEDDNTRRPRFDLSLRAGPETNLSVTRSFAKPPGEQFTLDAGLTIDAKTASLTDMLLDMNLAGGRISIENTSLSLNSGDNVPNRPSVSIAGEFGIAHLDKLLSCCVPLVKIAPFVGGGASGRFEFQQSRNQQQFSLITNLTGLEIGENEYFVKPSGDKLTLGLEAQKNDSHTAITLRLDSPDLTIYSAANPTTFNIKNKPFSFTITNILIPKANGEVLLQSGSCELAVGKSKAQITCEDFLINIFQKPPDASGTAALRGTITADIDAAEVLGGIFAGVTNITREHKLGGTVGILGKFSVSPNDGLALRCSIPTNLVIDNFRGYSIPVGLPPRAEFALTAAPDLSELYLRECTLTAGDNSIELSGKAKPVFAADNHSAWTLPQSVNPSEFHIALSAEADSLARMIHALKKYRPTGGVFLDIQWKTGGEKESTITNATLFAQNLRGQFRGRDVLLDGELFAKNVHFDRSGFVSADRLVTSGLEFQAGDNRGWIIADAANIFADYAPAALPPRGEFKVLLEYFDDKDMADWLSAHPEASTTRTTTSDIKKRAVEIISQLRNVLRGAELQGICTAKLFRTFDPTVNEHYNVNNLDLAVAADNGKLSADYLAGLYGGTIQTSLVTQIRDVDPEVVSRTEMLEVAATPEIRPQISRIFPGNTVTGMFSRWEKVKYPLSEMVCNALDKSFAITPEGETKMIAETGVVIGRSAPKFVTKIFPGLNLSEYKYEKMTSFGKLKGDGSTENETIFSGLYDLYMDGTTDKENRIKYTIGLVMLGTAISAEWHRDWKQGRFPLLNVSGQIRNGLLVDDTVAYPWPTETFYEMCVRYNIIYMAWVNTQKKKAQKESQATP